VGHDRLLTASGYHGGHTEHLPIGSMDVLEFGDVAASPVTDVAPSPISDVVASPDADHPAATCALGPAVESARRAREFTRLTLQDWGLAGSCDVAELVVSELVTNSLRHGLLSAQWMPGEHPIGLTILRRDPYLMCMVTDPGSKRPVRVESSPGAESGRGLQVVESCSVRWGWEPAAGEGKVVWALLQLTELRRTAGQAWPGSAASVLRCSR
jgi:anti-sigma regulatory factor (Ser/Thr protein kinase)